MTTEKSINNKTCLRHRPSSRFTRLLRIVVVSSIDVILLDALLPSRIRPRVFPNVARRSCLIGIFQSYIPAAPESDHCGLHPRSSGDAGDNSIIKDVGGRRIHVSTQIYAASSRLNEFQAIGTMAGIHYGWKVSVPIRARCATRVSAISLAAPRRETETAELDRRVFTRTAKN